MTEQIVVGYLVNSAWQIPLLALGAWALVKTARAEARLEHWVWLSVLAMAVVMPLRPIGSERLEPPVAPAAQNFVLWEGRDAPFTMIPVATPSPVTQQEPPIAHGIVLSVAATRWLVRLYAVTVLSGMLRLLWAWMGTRRLLRESRELVMPPESMREFAECGERLHVGLPELRMSHGVSGPVVVGAFRPVLLLPERFAEHAGTKIRAALLHELAHVRRRDYLVNLICRMAALPVAWHPVTMAIQRRIRLTREMACDAVAAEEMQSGEGYAWCLISLAQQMLGESARTQALGLFEKGTLEERVMRLTEMETGTETKTMIGPPKVLRVAVGLAAMVTVTAVAAMLPVRPTFAAAATETTSAAMAQTAVTQTSVAQTTAAATAPAAEAKPTAAIPAVEANQAEAPAAPAAAGTAHPEIIPDGASPPVIEEDGPTAVAGEGKYVHRWVGADGKKYVVVNRNPKEPTAEERLREEQKFRDAQVELDKVRQDAAGIKLDSEQMKLDSAAMKVQMEGWQKQFNKDFLRQQVDAANRIANDPKMKQQMAELQKQMAETGKNMQLNMLNNPGWKKQMDEMQKKFNDPGWQKQIADVEANAQVKALESLELTKQLAEVQKNLASLNAERWGDATKAQKELESGELKAKLDAAQRMLDEVRQQMQQMQPK